MRKTEKLARITRSVSNVLGILIVIALAACGSGDSLSGTQMSTDRYRESLPGRDVYGNLQVTTETKGDTVTVRFAKPADTWRDPRPKRLEPTVAWIARGSAPCELKAKRDGKLARIEGGQTCTIGGRTLTVKHGTIWVKDEVLNVDLSGELGSSSYMLTYPMIIGDEPLKMQTGPDQTAGAAKTAGAARMAGAAPMVIVPFPIPTGLASVPTLKEAVAAMDQVRAIACGCTDADCADAAAKSASNVASKYRLELELEPIAATVFRDATNAVFACINAIQAGRPVPTGPPVTTVPDTAVPATPKFPLVQIGIEAMESHRAAACACKNAQCSDTVMKKAEQDLEKFQTLLSSYPYYFDFVKRAFDAVTACAGRPAPTSSTQGGAKARE